MSEREYWFARRFPLSDRRQAFAPVHWKGYLVSLVFGILLTGGGVAFAWLGANNEMFEGVIVFAIISMLAVIWFTMTAKANGDRIRTVADYKKDKQRV